MINSLNYKIDDDDNSTPPRTFHEYMMLNCLSDWPHRLTSENLPDLKESLIDFGSEEGILNLLKAVVTINEDPLKKLCGKLKVFEDELAAVADKLLDLSSDDATLPKALINQYSKLLSSNLLFKGYSPLNATYEIAKSTVELTVGDNQETGRNVMARLKQLENRGIQNCQVPSFRAAELSPLPSNLESRQILNDVLTLQQFPLTMTLFWKKILLSEASVAMLHDTFWWTFIDQFQPDRTYDRSKLFDRLSDTFVALCYSIGSSVKDKVFLAFSSCLAQAVYAVFARAFPASQHLFDATFKQYLINNTCEWISGLQPSAGSWMKWNFSSLELQDQRTDSEVAELSLIIRGGTWRTPDFTGAHYVVQSISAGGHPDNPSVTDCSPTKSTSVKTPAAELSHSIVVTKSKESHPVGQGAELERVLFELKGRSVLVSHFLKMRQLQAKEFHSAKVHHTRVKKLPSPNALTYNQLLEEIWQKHMNSKRKHLNRLDHIQTATEERIAKLQSSLSASSSNDVISDSSDDESV